MFVLSLSWQIFGVLSTWFYIKMALKKTISAPASVPLALLVSTCSFSAEITSAAATWMAERAGSMLDFVSQEDCRSGKKRGRQKRRRTPPSLTLKSFVLQEAEAVGREAKLRVATAMGLRVVNLQHDGVVVTGVGDGRQGGVAYGQGPAVCSP